jgi:hypothetical protein
MKCSTCLGLPSPPDTPAGRWNGGGVTVEIQATGEQLYARIVDDDPAGPVSIRFGALGHVRYAGAMLESGWRIIHATPEELAILESFGIVPNLP